MTAQGRTLTVPDRKDGLLGEPGAVVGLRERETGVLHALDPARTRFEIGASAECDVVVRSRYVSGKHCALERREIRLRVRDLGSHNGTFLAGARVEEGDLAAGDRLVLAGGAGVSLLAVDEAMRTAERTLAAILGFFAHRVIDDVLARALEPVGSGGDAARPGDLAIIAEAGCDQDTLVDVIHHLSRRRSVPLVRLAELPTELDAQRQLVESLRRGTLALSVGERSRPIDNLARAMLFAPENQVRLVISGPTRDSILHVIGVDAFARAHVIELAPVRTRASEIERLVDLAFELRRSSRRFAMLTDDNRAALRGYGWPGNLAQLREVVGWIDTIVAAGSLRKAVDVLGVKRSTLQDRLSEVGLVLPLTDKRFAAIR